jgi:hypothetical protein
MGAILFLIVFILIVFKFIKDKDNRAIVISILALIFSYIVFIDRFFPPTIKIIDVTPIITIKECPDLRMTEDFLIPEKKGIYLLLNVVSGGCETYCQSAFKSAPKNSVKSAPLAESKLSFFNLLSCMVFF